MPQSSAAAFHDFVLAQVSDKSGDNSTQSGSSKQHYGLSNPTLRGFVKQWAKDHPDLSYEQWQATLHDLYHSASVDEVMLAGFMLGQYASYRRRLPLSVLDGWIGQLEGWREIDTTCQSNYTASDLLATWTHWQPFLLQLADRETRPHQRASLVLLVKPVRDSADPRLIETALANIERLKGESDKLLTKAVSWVLREAVKRHRDTVAAYVETHAESLPALAVREFNKKLTTGKK